jgi:3-methyladenine DNA glycosylase Mpg
MAKKAKVNSRYKVNMSVQAYDLAKAGSAMTIKVHERGTTLGGCETGGTIIEAEAYDQNDMSAHCYIGYHNAPPASARPMTFGGGHLYFYYTRNGRCMNVTCEGGLEALFSLGRSGQQLDLK